MSTTTFGPEVQTGPIGPNLETPLPFDLAWSGILNPNDLAPNELFHGIQSITVPEQRLVEGDGTVGIRTVFGGVESVVRLPVGMVVSTERYVPEVDEIWTSSPSFVSLRGSLLPMGQWPANDPPAPVAFREAARVDSTEQVFFGDQAPTRVSQHPTAPTLETSWIPVEGRYHVTRLTSAPRSEHVFTTKDQFELKRRLGSDDVIGIAGKTSVAEVTEVDFAVDLKAAEEETRDIRMTIPASAPVPTSRWAALHDIVAERQAGLDLDGISMTHRAAMGLRGDNSNEEGLTHQPSVVVKEVRDVPATGNNEPTQEIVMPRRGVKAYLAAGAAALTHMIPVGKSRAGQRRASEGGEPTVGRHRATVTSIRTGRHRQTV